MRIGLFGKSLADKNVVYLNQLLKKLKVSNIAYCFYDPYIKQISSKINVQEDIPTFHDFQSLQKQADILFSIGGDGTLLDTLSLIRDSGMPILGVNLGRLGFLSSISRDDIIPAIDHLVNGNYKLEERTLLNLVTNKGIEGELNYALNDLTITRKDTTSLIVTHVYVDDYYLNSYWADGLIIATPTGSTAYSLSSGGPILTPGSENFVITPIAPHNLTIRPIVISDKSEIRIKAEGRDKKFLVSLDSHLFEIDNSVELFIKKEDFKINLIQIADKSFFLTIRDKLKWGLDVRN